MPIRSRICSAQQQCLSCRTCSCCKGKLAFQTSPPHPWSSRNAGIDVPHDWMGFGASLLVHLGSKVHVQAGRHCHFPIRRLRHIDVSRQRWPTWLKMSATEWMDSASMALLPDTQKVAILATKMAMLAEMAAETHEQLREPVRQHKVEDAGHLPRGYTSAPQYSSIAPLPQCWGHTGEKVCNRDTAAAGFCSGMLRHDVTVAECRASQIAIASRLGQRRSVPATVCPGVVADGTNKPPVLHGLICCRGPHQH